MQNEWLERNLPCDLTTHLGLLPGQSYLTQRDFRNGETFYLIKCGNQFKVLRMDQDDEVYRTALSWAEVMSKKDTPTKFSVFFAGLFNRLLAQ